LERDYRAEARAEPVRWARFLSADGARAGSRHADVGCE